MISNPADPALTLLELSDLDHLPPSARRYEAALRTIVGWVRSYLSAPHPDLGRAGDVCPYARASLDRSGLYLTVYPGRPGSPDRVADALRPYSDWFTRLAPADDPAARHTAILVLFPDLEGPDLPRIVDAAQHALKPRYTSRGLMIGEFHDGPPDKPGLHNPGFRPLASPVPLLAIRRMVPTDLAFLRDDPELLRNYLRVFGTQLPARLRETAGAHLAALETAPATITVGKPT